MTDNKNNVPQFVACGLEMGNCPRQIPYDMAEHERIIMADLLDKVAEKIKEECGIYFDNDYSSSNQEPMYLCSEIDEVVAEMKAEVVR